MTEIDWIIIALLALSTIVGIMRGVMREVLAIAGWVIGILLAMNFSADLAEHIPLESIGWIPRVMIAAVLIIVAVLFICGLIGMLIRKMLEVAKTVRSEPYSDSCAASWWSAPASSYSACPQAFTAAVCGSSPY